MDQGRMRPEDYLDDNLPYAGGRKSRIAIGQVIEKLDGYLARNDQAAAGRHLAYWTEEARAIGDRRAEFTLVNERIGFCRKNRDRAGALEAAACAVGLVEEMGIDDSVSGATAWINAATAYKAFGMAKEALPLYEKAQKIYLRDLAADDARLGGLWNNYALALCETENYAEAERLLHRAIGVMMQNRMLPEAAVSYLNLADLYEARDGLEDGAERIEKSLDEAERLLDDVSCPRDGNYAFVCEKSHPVFDYFGRFAFAAELRERAEAIYGGEA